jgi:hypothetical protein
MIPNRHFAVEEDHEPREQDVLCSGFQDYTGKLSRYRTNPANFRFDISGFTRIPFLFVWR